MSEEKVRAFNMKIAALLKEVAPEDLATILTHEKSLLAAADNQNQNQGRRELAETVPVATVNK